MVGEGLKGLALRPTARALKGGMPAGPEGLGRFRAPRGASWTFPHRNPGPIDLEVVDNRIMIPSITSYFLNDNRAANTA